MKIRDKLIPFKEKMMNMDFPSDWKFAAEISKISPTKSKKVNDALFVLTLIMIFKSFYSDFSDKYFASFSLSCMSLYLIFLH